MDYSLSIQYLCVFQNYPYIIQSVRAMVKAYVNIKLPEELAREVDELVKDRTLGYRSRGEFVTEATRTLLIKIKFLKKL
jgi:hypothetical protein